MDAKNSELERTILDVWCARLQKAGKPENVGANILDLIYSSCPVADLNMSEHQVRAVAECLLLAGIEIGFPRLNTAAVAQLLTDLEPGAAYHPVAMERLRAQIIASTKLPEGSL